MGSLGPTHNHNLTPFTSPHFQFFPEEEHQRLRALVPLLSDKDKNMTYLNASFQPPMNARVRTALDEYLDQATYNQHPKPIWQSNVSKTRAKLATYLNVPTDSIAFTRDTTEGLNLFQRSLKFESGDNVVVLDEEHPNHVYGWLALRDLGLEVRRVPAHEDMYADASTFEPYIDQRTVAIGLSTVMFHSGQMNDVQDICDGLRPRGIHVLADLTQHVGIAEIDLSAWGVSAAAFGCHKGLASPGGIGVLYIDPAVLPTLKSTPPMVGAGAVANVPSNLVADSNVIYHDTSLRYDHLNLSFIGISALKAYLGFVVDEMGPSRLENHLRALGRVLAVGCQKLGVQIVGSKFAEQRAPHLYILDLMDPAWEAHFKEENVLVSHYRKGVRVSFGFYNSAADVRNFLASIERGLAKGVPCH